MLRRTPVDGYTGTCEAIRNADLWSLVPHVSNSTLVRCGARDLATPPEDAVQLADTMPNAECQIIADAAHLPRVEQPEAVATIIQAFLRRTQP